MLFFNANFICYYFYPTKKREEPKIFPLFEKRAGFFDGEGKWKEKNLYN